MWGARVVVVGMLVVLLTGMVSGTMFPVRNQDDWNRGTFDGTEASGGSLQLSSGVDLGNYTSRVFDAGDRYGWEKLVAESDLNGGDINVTVAVSQDDFQTVWRRQTIELTGGSEEFNLDVPETRWVRFNLSVSRGASSPVLDSLNITLGGNIRFIVRNESCLAAEQEMFSFSNLSNAHAGDPGYWPGYHMCTSGLANVQFTNICSGDTRPIMSFYGSEQNYTHLATDARLFDYQVCTESLSIGVRDKCTNQTKAMVSIFSTPESHIAEPGVYNHQLCGGIINTVTAGMRFRLGSTDDVYINTTSVTPGTYARIRDSGFIAAENATMAAGLVAGENTRITTIRYDESGGMHLFNMTQDREEDVSFYIPFTRGDRLDLEDRRILIARGQFLDKINPNFGLQFAEEMLVRLTLGLTDIDLVTDLSLSPGFYDIVLRNVGETASGTPQVAVNVTG